MTRDGLELGCQYSNGSVQLHKIDTRFPLKSFLVIMKQSKIEIWNLNILETMQAIGVWVSHTSESNIKVGFVGSWLHLRHFSDKYFLLDF